MLILCCFYTQLLFSDPTRLLLLDSGSKPLPELESGIVTHEGHLLLGNADDLYHWLPDGSLSAQIHLPDVEIRSYYYGNEIYWVCGLKDNQILSVFYRGTSEGTEEIDRVEGLYTPFFNIVDNSFYIPCRVYPGFFFPGLIGSDYIYENNYAFLACEATSSLVQGASYLPRLTGLEFLKINDRMLEMELNFKQYWLVRESTQFLVVNQLEPRVYFHSQETMQQEARDGQQHPSDIPFQELDLAGFSPPGPRYWEPQRSMTVAEAKPLYREWWYSLNLISFFGKVQDRYIISFRDPDKNDTPQVQGFHNVIQIFDKSFSRIGGPLEINGMILGTHDNALYLFGMYGESAAVCIYRDF